MKREMPAFLYGTLYIRFFYIVSFYNGADERRKGGGATDASVFQFLDKARLCKSSLGFCKVLIGVER
jgi:hypothetical protein